MNEDEEKVEQSLMISPTSFPKEKFTKDGKGYYYTRGDGTPITHGHPLSILRFSPTINTIWSLFDKPGSTDWTPRDMAFPLNVPYGGKRQGNLSDWAFTSWLVNTAPSQIGALGKGIQATKGKYFYKPPVKPPINVTPNQTKNQIIDEAFSLTKRTNLPSPIQTAQRRMGMKFGEQGVLGKNLKGQNLSGYGDSYAEEAALKGFPVTTLTGKINSKFNPYLTYGERKGIVPIPSSEEIIRRANIGRNWEHIDSQSDKRPSPPFIFNNKEYTETTLISNYQPKIIKPRTVYGPRATTIEGIEGKASDTQFTKIREGADVVGGVKDMVSKTPLWKPAKTITLKGKEILKGYRVHHEAPLAPSATIKAGLNDEARIEADLYMLERGMPQGNLVENLTVVPHDLHMPVLHKFIDSRLGKSDLNKIVEKHYPGRKIWELELWERKPIFDEYVQVINESRELTYDFYRALAAYDLPKGATIETTINAALQLDNEKLELLIFDMLGRGGEKMDFASDFFSSISPTESLQPAPKGRLEALLDTSKDIDQLIIRLNNHEKGLDMIIDRMMGMSPTAVKRKYRKGNVNYDPNIKQLDLAIKQVTPEIKDALIKKYANANDMSLEEIYSRLEAGWHVNFDNMIDEVFKNR